MLTEALQVLKRGGYKLTKQRKSMLEYLSRFKHQYVDIKTIDAHMRKIYPTMSHNTIYRNIKEFEELGIVETRRKAGGASVKYQCDFDNVHHHHFICRNCGHVQEIQMCPLEVFADQLPGCLIEDHRFELHGLCANCQRKLAKV
ncbi:transcriptional repressor [Ligilactobacillus sp. Marseille-Q7487]|uniref:Fur family transcriptional regulator n=1 Tax=Ligilactobacillus sp. Marseille-Q7487 TaxID=3022128 RepID=UPI0024A84511|nr:transcriptional repressor [Ligilactobacillus sp. Marseille-Q7487]